MNWIDSWPILAKENPLVFKPGHFLKPPTLTGSYKGYNIQIDLITLGNYEAGVTETYTRFILSLMDVFQGRINLSTRGLLGKVRIKTGDKQFDKKFVIECQPKNLALSLFASASLRDKLLQSQLSQLSINENMLSILVVGVVNELNRLYGYLELLIELVKIIEPEENSSPDLSGKN